MAVRAPRHPAALRSALAAAILTAIIAAGAAVPPPAAARLTEGFHPDGRSMWIWYLDRSDGGDVSAIVARARTANVRTLIIKAADGTNLWSQFNPALVRELHAAGLHVCAWQYVYGSDPAGEAALGERAALAGADCLVIDAEAEYEGRYAAAQTYMGDLRAVLGHRYAIGLASFPYVDYHPAFPYSVFLGPGGANFSLPQMYWQDIGDSVDTVFAHTYEANRIYGRPLYPTGQTYGTPDPAGVLRFREVTKAYGAPGLTWWDYAWTSASGLWGNIGQLLFTPVGFTGPSDALPLLGPGDEGDQVLWLQEHLATAEPSQRVTGLFADETAANLRAFQAARRLPVSGMTDAATWHALLALRPVAIAWTATASAATTRAGAARARASAATLSGIPAGLASAARAAVRVQGPPPSASLPALGYEVPETGAAHPAPCRTGATCPAPGPPARVG